MFDDAMRTWASLHVVPGRWVVESNGGETGRVWDWLLSMLGVPVEDADELATASPVGARDVMAVLGAPRMNAAAMNAGVGGLTLPLPLVMSSPERSDLLRSVLEAMAFTVRANLEQAEEVAGMPVHELRLAGGMSRSGPFARILADVIDRPLHVAGTPETSALGAAVLAAPALGVHPSFSAAVDAMVRPSAIVLPESRASVEYEDLYQRWLAMCDAFSSMP
jgi:L-ribulokinase